MRQDKPDKADKVGKADKRKPGPEPDHLVITDKPDDALDKLFKSKPKHKRSEPQTKPPASK